MELKTIQTRIKTYAGKYRYMILLVLVGIVLLLLPTPGNTTPKKAEAAVIDTSDVHDLNMQLEEILRQIDGAGEVQVLLSVAAGEEMIYQSDTDRSFTSDSTHEKSDAVIITDGNRAQAGLIRQVNPPTYLGAVIVCKGADSPSVRLAIVNAVSKLTGLGADCISVLKMK